MTTGVLVARNPMLRPSRRPPNWHGGGYLSGEYPGGIATVEGVPTSAEVLVRLRDPGSYFDGFTVAITTSAPDGTWRVDGLDPTRRYDVIGRKEGHNDVIVSNVQPENEERVL